jgi:hypothetical protein
MTQGLITDTPMGEVEGLEEAMQPWRVELNILDPWRRRSGLSSQNQLMHLSHISLPYIPHSDNHGV